MKHRAKIFPSEGWAKFKEEKTRVAAELLEKGLLMLSHEEEV